MEKINNLKDLFVNQAKDIYHAEKKFLSHFYTEIRNHAAAAELKEAIDQSKRECDNHVQRLESVFKKLNLPTPATSPEKGLGVENMIKEINNLVKRCESKNVRDAAIISSLQRINHYEISVYGSLRTFAEELGHGDLSESIQKSLEEEKKIDLKLTKLATERINEKAMV
jgi:ferritin-like metal-binding protein YciE